MVLIAERPAASVTSWPRASRRRTLVNDGVLAAAGP
jgi:hypothetical protein